ncbi:MAG: bifunctional 2-polyprenyl-6-hydroxyphenol methylase/3-demethylubiquinol 3-O-methyltransferase UbiG [Myxococcota bacterium]|nr:bifunctional 2-polyprenyl-6-hydroxyphenol methylase/3-demethylubiquinol 3-O-methyltransferase UbiG [Myxococcota bacterium]
MIRQPKVIRNDLTIYDQVDPWWDEEATLLDPLRRLAHPRMAYLSRFVDPFGMHLLDVGCGGGFLSTLVAKAGAHVTGIDSAAGAIQAARNKAEQDGLHVDYRVGAAEKLPFGDEVFDLVICTDVLVHVDDPRVVLTEILRVLKPGGRLFFSCINRTFLAKVVMITLAENLIGVVPKGTHDWKKFIKPNELESWLRKDGAKIERKTGIGPVGWKGGFTFGQQPFSSVMYQGIATKIFRLNTEGGC